ncbi:MAG: pyridoxamine 5'-phosphate oxidase family protein [Acidimicrobiia bacterium]
MRWEELEQLEPSLAELGRTKLGEPGVVLVGTIRADGSPRVSPVEPLFWNRDLWLSMGWGTQKAIDLRRDPRILVHSIVTSREGTGGEYKLRGRAVAEADPQVHDSYATAVASRLGWQPEPGRFHLFRVDVEEVTFIRWDSATNDQYVTRWPAGEEFIRRGTSPTSLSDPEPFHELLT